MATELWCDACGRVAEATPGTDPPLCANCSVPLREASAEDHAGLARELEADEQSSLEAGRAEDARDWRTLPADQVPPWRRADREWLDANPPPAGENDDLVDDLADLARLHHAGKLTDREFAAAKTRLLGGDQRA